MAEHPRIAPHTPDTAATATGTKPFTVIKQYGERRTGTNYLRSLLAVNFADVPLLMHALGDKHSPPVALEELWQRAAAAPDPAWEFVRQATFAAPAMTTLQGDEKLNGELRRVAGAVTQAYLHGTLGYLISIKNPYAWITSLSRYLGWSWGARIIPSRHRTSIESECKQFNARYAAWLELRERQPEDVLVVRHEDLLASPETVMEKVRQQFGLRRTTAQILRPTGHVLPMYWDYSTQTMAAIPFDTTYYTQSRYLQSIPDDLRLALRNTVDWGLMKHFGYEPL